MQFWLKPCDIFAFPPWWPGELYRGEQKLMIWSMGRGVTWKSTWRTWRVMDIRTQYLSPAAWPPGCSWYCWQWEFFSSSLSSLSGWLPSKPIVRLKEHKLSMCDSYRARMYITQTLQALPRDPLSAAGEVFFGVQIWKRGIILQNQNLEKRYFSSKPFILWGITIVLQVCDFPSLSSAASINLSVIVPAYNEEERLPKVFALYRT